MTTIAKAGSGWPATEVVESWKAKRDEWLEVSQFFFDEMLGAVPPIYKRMRNAFLCGEPYSDSHRGTIYYGFAKVGGRCFSRLIEEDLFDDAVRELMRLVEQEAP